MSELSYVKLFWLGFVLQPLCPSRSERNETTPSGFACHPSGGGEFGSFPSFGGVPRRGGVVLSPCEGGVPEGRGGLTRGLGAVV